MSHSFSHGYALLIGVGACDYSNWSLPVTVKDAQALKQILTDASLCAYPDDKQHVRLLHDKSANRDAILDGLTWLKVQTEQDAEATAVVYFSGHGWLDEKNKRYYLIPADVKPFNIPVSALLADDFIAALRQVPAQRLLAIIDCCHAEGMASAKDPSGLDLPPEFTAVPLPKSIAQSLNQGEGRAVFTSSRGSQKSWIRQDNNLSIFTYHLIEALQGANNRPGDTVVRVSNLMNHLSQTVPQSALDQRQADQSPFFDMATEDFPVALLYGGKGLTEKRLKELQEDTQPSSVQITGDGNIVGNNNVLQTIRASGGSRISHVTQTANLPAAKRSPILHSATKDIDATSRVLRHHFSRADLDQLSNRLNIDTDELSADMTDELVAQILDRVVQEGRLLELLEHCYQIKPRIDW